VDRRVDLDLVDFEMAELGVSGTDGCHSSAICIALPSKQDLLTVRMNVCACYILGSTSQAFRSKVTNAERVRRMMPKLDKVNAFKDSQVNKLVDAFQGLLGQSSGGLTIS
jgi:hypothetical protein